MKQSEVKTTALSYRIFSTLEGILPMRRDNPLIPQSKKSRLILLIVPGEKKRFDLLKQKT